MIIIYAVIVQAKQLLTVTDWTAELVQSPATAVSGRRAFTHSHRTQDLSAFHARTVCTLVHQPTLPRTVHVRVVRAVLQRAA